MRYAAMTRSNDVKRFCFEKNSKHLIIKRNIITLVPDLLSV